MSRRTVWPGAAGKRAAGTGEGAVAAKGVLGWAVGEGGRSSHVAGRSYSADDARSESRKAAGTSGSREGEPTGAVAPPPPSLAVAEEKACSAMAASHAARRSSATPAACNGIPR